MSYFKWEGFVINTDHVASCTMSVKKNYCKPMVTIRGPAGAAIAWKEYETDQETARSYDSLIDKLIELNYNPMSE